MSVAWSLATIVSATGGDNHLATRFLRLNALLGRLVRFLPIPYSPYAIIISKGESAMPTSAITVKFQVNDEQAAKKLCDVLDRDGVKANLSKCRNGTAKDVSKLVKAYRS